ncbi:hypothetical protein SteCoe_26889 [Stentor coeruleus]|uniref:Uncharacterized protein n=1 Tax=Stentor coeruleus TaxID=5963 RepID=A0A1R2BBS4_9CILI|nr:hypothetical protein SteCoe_26889 [Stentor coeruleus]
MSDRKVKNNDARRNVKQGYNTFKNNDLNESLQSLTMNRSVDTLIVPAEKIIEKKKCSEFLCLYLYLFLNFIVMLLLIYLKLETYAIKPLNLENVCVQTDIFKIDSMCLKGQDFCTTFNSPFYTTKEKIELLRDNFHWIPTDFGKYLELHTIKGVHNCKYFIGITNDAFLLWEFKGFFPSGIKVKSPIIYRMSPNEKFVVIATSDAYIRKISIPSFQIHNLNSFFAKLSPSDIYISNNSDLILLYYITKGTIDVFNANNFQLITLEGIYGKIDKIFFTNSQNDVILKDAECLKIYFIFVSKPAYLIRSYKDYKSLLNQYCDLIAFENYYIKRK